MWTISRNKYEPHYLKNKDFLWIYYCISEMCMQFRPFKKKDEYPSLIISEITDCERGGYLNV